MTSAIQGSALLCCGTSNDCAVFMDDTDGAAPEPAAKAPEPAAAVAWAGPPNTVGGTMPAWVGSSMAAAPRRAAESVRLRARRPDHVAQAVHQLLRCMANRRSASAIGRPCEPFVEARYEKALRDGGGSARANVEQKLAESRAVGTAAHPSGHSQAITAMAHRSVRKSTAFPSTCSGSCSTACPW